MRSKVPSRRHVTQGFCVLVQQPGDFHPLGAKLDPVGQGDRKGEQMRGIGKLAVVVGAVAMPIVLAGAPAQAAPKAADGEVGVQHAACGRNGTYLDRRTFTGGTAGAHIRTGSDVGCTGRGSIQPAHSLTYYCWTRGNDGYSWTYLRDNSTRVLGWTRDDLLPGYGSDVNCGF
jgi:hypothetical protein